MSRLGKKPLDIPANTEITISENLVVVKGSKGQLEMNYLPTKVEIKQEGSQIVTKPVKENIECNSLWGTYSSIMKSMMIGVTEGFEKRLIIEGVGFKAAVNGDKIVLNVGFSHQVEIEIASDLTVAVEKDNIIISGIDKQKVGHLAAVIRSKKKPEPYKGKGIRYINEIVRRKEGKKSA